MRRSSFPRLALILLLLTVAAAQLRAETKLAENVRVDENVMDLFAQWALIILMGPFGAAYELEHMGLPRYPYETDEGYIGGARDVSLALNGSTQFVGRGRTAQHYLLRLRTTGRLGGDFSSAVFEPGALADARSTYHGLHFSGNYCQSKMVLVDAGLGLAALHDPTSRWGPSLHASVEVFPKRPLHGSVGYRLGFPGGLPHHDLSLLFGAGWKGVGLDAGGRFFLTPGKDLIGPEVGRQVLPHAGQGPHRARGRSAGLVLSIISPRA
ncbi:MAG: hypothetical protein HY748_14095 [Elusimicrobia bacterium]|nr:hypothetical protein [Elusimicrobiota bacterium]